MLSPLVVLIKCLFAIDTVDVDVVRLNFSCPIFPGDVVGIDGFCCRSAPSELIGLEMPGAEDAAAGVLLVVLVMMVDFCADIAKGRDWLGGGRGGDGIAAFVSQATEIELRVAEFERWNRSLRVLPFCF